MTDFQYGKWLSTPSEGEEVVISGLSAHLPDSANVYEFQHNLFNKINMVTDEDRRWQVNHPEIPKKTGTLLETNKFDAGYFGVHYRQANIMDPMIRIFLETCIEAVMDAGINPSDLAGSRTGVFVGACFSDMEYDVLTNGTKSQRFGVTGYLRCMSANRISYFLKLKGPSVIVDTACSSSFNALELGFKAIRSGQCDNALIGGTNILQHPGMTLQFSRLGVLSKDGICKVFDQSADGYARSDAETCIFLQKAKNAKRIYSKVVHIKVNCDGFTPLGITFPSAEMQEQLMNDIQKETGTSVSDISFLEAHGTGTEVGDPQEVEAVDSAIAKKREKPLLVGSVKCSIGHSEPASGLSSLIKVIIAMETGLIAPNINLKEVKKGMFGFHEGRMKIVTELTELEGEGALVGINNFGFGGNNCHMLVRRFKKKKVNNGQPRDDIPRLVCVSGRTEESVSKFLSFLKENPLDNEYVGLLHQLFKKDISEHPYRGYTILSKKGPVTSSIKFIDYQPPLYIIFGCFSNNFARLGKYLLEFPAFKSSISRVNDYLKKKNINIFDVILEKELEKERDYLGAIVVQIGLVDILKLLKIKPTRVYGSSLGKLVVGYYNDVISLEEVLSTVLKIVNLPVFSDFESSKTKWNSMPLDDHLVVVDRNKSDQLNYTDYRYLKNIPTRCILLNISDDHLFKTDLLPVEGNTVKFLEILGRLYEEGFNPQIHKLYPPIEFPVSRSTPMISPFITWNHSWEWYTYKFQGLESLDVKQKRFNINYINEECRYIVGHSVDGRNFIPATEFLSLVWQTVAHSRRLLITDTPIIFENCRFIRAVTMQKSGFVRLLVSVQEGTGNFEIVEKDSLVVSGRVYCPTNINMHKTNLPPVKLDETDRTRILEQDEIYRELYLRGYNYSGLFKGIVRCNSEATAGLIKWEDNWTTFMDKMLQMKILQTDTRLLYVPVSIQKLIIDTSEHLEVVKNSDLIPVNVYANNNIIKSGGIEIMGLQARSISRRKPTIKPVLEKYEFVPNSAHLDLTQAIRSNIQIVLENSLENNFKAVEIVDEFSETESKLLLPIVYNVLEDVPMVNPDLIVSTKNTLEEMPYIKTEDFTLTSTSSLSLIVGSNILQKKNLNSILNALSKNGFVLTREKTNFAVEISEDIEIITEYTTENEKLSLFRKSEPEENIKYIEVSSQNFSWLMDLQKALKSESNIILYSQDQEFSGILGLVNCIRREPGGNKVRCFFMMDQAIKFDPTITFYKNQIKKNLAINVYKNSQWGTYRHLLLEDVENVEGQHFYVNEAVLGDVSSLQWMTGPLTPQTPVEENKTFVYIYYSSINFKDIMLATGRINADAFTEDRIKQQCLLGFEFSGKDAGGRRVMGVNSGALSTYVVADSTFLLEVPDDWTLEEAATIPAVYATVVYSLLYIASLKSGMSVLIHSATGGIGMAAINVCNYYGCTVFVTVGNQAKKDYLRKLYPQIPESHIGNSHDTSFEEMIKTETNGRGVDVVLNSLAEEKLFASIRCLANGGQMLEIGKYDIANNSILNVLLLEKEASYTGVMLDRIFDLSPEAKKWLVGAMYEGIRLGYIKPLPTTVFQPNETEKAFRHMMTGKHIGKIIIKIRNEEENKKARPSEIKLTGVPRFCCDSQKCYIIIGGLGGFGLELADWLVLRGAKNVILVSSSGIKTGYQKQRISIWESYGANIHVSRINTTTKEGCYKLLEISKKYGVLDGIFNLAVVLEDALFEDQTEEKFLTSLSPKAFTAKYLDEVTREVCPNLRYFVVFSSVSCGRGNVGQSNYGMANSIMERICEKRKRDGFAALAIQWGAIGEVGLVAKMQKENKELVIGGTLQQKVSSCLEALDRFLNQENAIVASMIVAEKRSKTGSSSAVETIAYMLGIKDLKKINPDATFAELGMDSMVGTELIQVLEKDFEIFVSAKEVRSLTFARISELEAEKTSSVINKHTSKIEERTGVMLRYLPDRKTSKLPVISLPSQVQELDAPEVFLICGIEGIFTPLETVTKQLNGRVFGLQYSYDNPKDTIEETAKAMLPHVEQRLTKDKNFYIVGYSFGAIVALELVTLLENKGYRGQVKLIEGSPAYLVTAAKNYLPSTNEAEFETMLSLRILSLLIPIETVLQMKDHFLKCANLDERLKLALSVIPKHMIDEGVESQTGIVLHKRFKAIVNYKYEHDKIKSTVHLLKAKYSMVSDIAEDYGLSEYCEQPVQVTELEGDHVTILNQDKVVEELNKLLTRNGKC